MLARFLTNTRGGVVPLMAVVAVPLMASVGIAVDYSRINAARTAFQVALDATALMMSKNAATETDAQRQTEATNTFNSLFSRPEVTDIAISPNFTSTGRSKRTLNGTAVVHTNFLGIIGVSQVEISACRFRRGAIRASVSPLRSTTPAPWPVTAKWILSRPHLTICSLS
jgi:Flp pilus assembly protein TadG